jgi:hypothetical protein
MIAQVTTTTDSVFVPVGRGKKLRDKARRKRLASMRLAGFRCVYCGKNLLSDLSAYRSATFDHFIPKCAGGAGNLTNCVACCQTCNSFKGSKVVETIEEAQELIDRNRFEYLDWLEEQGVVLGGTDVSGEEFDRAVVALRNLADKAGAMASKAQAMAQAIDRTERIVGGRYGGLRRFLSRLLWRNPR